MAEGTLKPVGGAPFPVDKGMDKETVKGVAAGIAALRMHLRYQEAADGEAAAELQEMADREGAEQLQKKKDGEPPMKYRKVGLRDGCLDYILKKLESGQWEHVGFQSADIMAFMKWYPDDTSMENLVKLADRGMRDMKDDLRDKGLGSFVPVSNDVVEELRRLLAPGIREYELDVTGSATSAEQARKAAAVGVVNHVVAAQFAQGGLLQFQTDESVPEGIYNKTLHVRVFALALYTQKIQSAYGTGSGTVEGANFLLEGPGGVGKTCTLLYFALRARSEGWIVLYYRVGDAVDEEGNLKQSETVAQQLIRQLLRYHETELKKIPIYRSNIADFLTDASNRNRAAEGWEHVMDYLHQTAVNARFLFAIDHYNLTFRPPNKNEKHHVLKRFAAFSSFRPKSGLLGGAPSSNWNPIGEEVFRDADRQNARNPVPRYNPGEIALLAKHLRTHGGLDNFTDKEIVDRSSCIPRLVDFIARACRLHQGNKAAASFEFEGLATDYYEGRVLRLVQRVTNEGDADHRREVMEFAAFQFRNRQVTALPKAWRHAGVFETTKTGEVVPVCRWAQDGFLRYMQIRKDDVLQKIAAFPPIRWLALEQFVVSALSTAGNLLCPTFLLNGDDAGQLNLAVTAVVRMERNKPLGVLNPGTTVVCYDGAAVADLVVYNKDSQLIFIQVSESTYPNHSSKMEDLWVKTIGNKTVGTKTVYDYFADATNNKALMKKKKLGTGLTFYLYVTSNQTVQAKKLASPDNLVRICHGDHLRVFGRGWDDVLKPKYAVQ